MSEPKEIFIPERQAPEVCKYGRPHCLINNNSAWVIIFSAIPFREVENVWLIECIFLKGKEFELSDRLWAYVFRQEGNRLRGFINLHDKSKDTMQAAMRLKEYEKQPA